MYFYFSQYKDRMIFIDYNGNYYTVSIGLYFSFEIVTYENSKKKNLGIRRIIYTYSKSCE